MFARNSTIPEAEGEKLEIPTRIVE